jgi:tetratricopeptide (TPR) repeat protein
MSRTDEGSVLRSVVVYESLWLEHQAELPALYFGRRPASLPASIVFAAHQCFARSDGSIRQAIERLQHNATSERDRWVVRLLCSTTGQSLHEGPAHTDPTPEPSRIEESKPRQEPEGAAPAQMHADAFSDEDMAGILADLGGLGALPAKRPSLSGSNQSAVACRNPVPQATSDDCIAHAVVKPSDAPRKPSSPPSIVQGSQVHESERASKAERAFDAAEAAYALGDSEEALTYADTAVMFMPQMPAYLALQTYLEAIQSVKSASLFESLNDRIDKAFAGTSPDARAYFYRGMLLRWGGKSFASKQAFRKGLELSPEDPDLLNALAER